MWIHVIVRSRFDDNIQRILCMHIDGSIQESLEYHDLLSENTYLEFYVGGIKTRCKI